MEVFLSICHCYSDQSTFVAGRGVMLVGVVFVLYTVRKLFNWSLIVCVLY